MRIVRLRRVRALAVGDAPVRIDCGRAPNTIVGKLMASQFARGGRRRRVLNEEARSAAGVHSFTSMNTHDGAEAPRYGELACIEHHPQISDYVPRRKRTMLATLVAGVTVAAAGEALTHGADRIAGVLPGVDASQISVQLAGGVKAWISAISLLAIAGLARLVFSLRRHRVDDVRGRYRVWKWIAWGGVAASVNAGIGLHTIIAGAARAATGWSLTPGAAEWWLAPLALIGGWIAMRMLLEIGESRISAAIMIAAGACYGVAAAGSLGWSPAALGAWGDVLTGGVPLVGHTLALAGTMLFARYVVLDVQGLIDHTPRPAKAPRKPKSEAKADAVAKPAVVAAPAVTPAPQRRESAPAAARLASQDDDDSEEAEDEGGQYLSKSERKRLRKQQQRRAA